MTGCPAHTADPGYRPCGNLCIGGPCPVVPVPVQRVPRYVARIVAAVRTELTPEQRATLTAGMRRRMRPLDCGCVARDDSRRIVARADDCDTHRRTK